MIGASKGGELALLLAATFPDLVGPVVAYTPSSVVRQGIDLAAQRPPLLSSWSLGGRPLPFAPVPQGVAPAHGERGVSFLPIYERGLDDVAADSEAVISVERALHAGRPWRQSRRGAASARGRVAGGRQDAGKPVRARITPHPARLTAI